MCTPEKKVEPHPETDLSANLISLQVAANAPLTEFFQQWDVGDTERLIQKLEEKFAERLQIEKKFQAAEESKYVLLIIND